MPGRVRSVRPTSAGRRRRAARPPPRRRRGGCGRGRSSRGRPIRAGSSRAERRPASSTVGQRRSEPRVVVADGRDGRLLQHDLAQPDPVGIGANAAGAVGGRDAPGQVAGVAIVPGEHRGAVERGRPVALAAGFGIIADMDQPRRPAQPDLTVAKQSPRSENRAQAAQPGGRRRRGAGRACWIRRSRSAALPRATSSRNWAAIAPKPYDKAADARTSSNGRAARARRGHAVSCAAARAKGWRLAHEGPLIASAVNRYFGYFLVREVKLSAEPFRRSSAAPEESTYAAGGGATCRPRRGAESTTPPSRMRSNRWARRFFQTSLARA